MRSAAIVVPDDNAELGFRRTCTCWPTIRSAGAPKRNGVVSTGMLSACTISLSKGVTGELIEYLTAAISPIFKPVIVADSVSVTMVNGDDPALVPVIIPST